MLTELKQPRSAARTESMATSASVQGVIAQASALSERLQLLLSNDRQHVNRTKRDGLCLLHWSIIFQHHQGMLLLLRHALCAPAFALLRPFEEAFLRSFAAMYGTDSQVAALWNGTYATEFELVGSLIDQKLVDQKLIFEPRFALRFKNIIKTLHGFTHGGKEQLVRQASGLDIVSSYTDDEVCSLVRETMLIAFLTALFVTEFLGYQAEYQSALAMVNEYVQGLIGLT